jgi:hypothetical protein
MSGNVDGHHQAINIAENVHYRTDRIADALGDLSRGEAAISRTCGFALQSATDFAANLTRY